jgi:hypothetical protein
MRQRFRQFIRGAGTVLEIWPAPRQYQFGNDLLFRSDAEALRRDWQMVGRDFWKAFHHHTADHDPLSSTHNPL